MASTKKLKSKKWNTQDVWFDLLGGANMLNTGTFSIEWVDEESDEPNVVYTMERVNILIYIGK